MKCYLRAILLIAIGLLLSKERVYSQGIPGSNLGNYGGVSSMDINPSMIADSRYRSHYTLGGGGVTFNNNTVGIQKKSFWNGKAFTNDSNYQVDCQIAR
jgi:hypothetical protein